jgi:hypothetical protein
MTAANTAVPGRVSRHIPTTLSAVENEGSRRDLESGNRPLSGSRRRQRYDADGSLPRVRLLDSVEVVLLRFARLTRKPSRLLASPMLTDWPGFDPCPDFVPGRRQSPGFNCSPNSCRFPWWGCC